MDKRIFAALLSIALLSGCAADEGIPAQSAGEHSGGNVGASERCSCGIHCGQRVRGGALRQIPGSLCRPRRNPQSLPGSLFRSRWNL